MTVTITPEARNEERDGETFHFCFDKCQTKFKTDPVFYASAKAADRSTTTLTDAQYTCPMHPEIVSDEPEPCPICGMALEPMVPSDEPSEKLTDLIRRTWIGAAVAVSLVILTMVSWSVCQSAIGSSISWRHMLSSHCRR